MKILIYGAGVIGCLYAALFGKAGYDVTVYARGKRLEALKKDGLQYVLNGKKEKAHVTIIGKLEREDKYDFIFLTVKENQVHQALEELSTNNSPNIVTMVNTLKPYSEWERICGKGRIIPAFPGAGGGIENGVLNAALTPWIIQPTTFAEMDGSRTERTRALSAIFKKAKIPYQIVKDMHQWQLCHLAMVVPLADAYYMAKRPEDAWKESEVMAATAKQLKANFKTLYSFGVTLSPRKMNLFRLAPVWILKSGLVITFKSSFANIFMFQHAMNAPDEMRELHEVFYEFLKRHHHSHFA